MNQRLTFLFSALLCICLAGAESLSAAQSDYIAIFSAEQATYRRVLLDGVGNRRIQVDLDSSGYAEIKIWGVTEESYIGRREFERGYLIPVRITVKFPTSNLMVVNVSGRRFSEVVKYKVLDSNMLIVDLYPGHLPPESIFREETIGSLWPNGRFEPDIQPNTLSGDSQTINTDSRVIQAGRLTEVYLSNRDIINRAIIWAGGVTGFGLIIILPLILFINRSRKMKIAARADANRSQISIDERAQEFMDHSDQLSYDEATLLADIDLNS